MTNVNMMQATNAYRDALRAAERILEQAKGGATESTQEARGPSFMDMVGESLKSAANAGYNSELTAMKAMNGKADLTDVVTAVAHAETALNTIVTIRDRAINAYQDIIKMPI